jgi:hypothetical protein
MSIEVDLFSHTSANDEIQNEEEICPICYEILYEKISHTIMECEHKFHSSCLIEWFRTSNNTSCPYCRNTKDRELNCYNRYNDILFNMKVKFSKTKKSPKEFTKLINQYQKLKLKVRMLDKEYKEVCKKVNKIDRNLSYKEYLTQRKLLMKNKRSIFKRRSRRRIKFFEIRNAIELIPIKPIILKTKK